MFGMRSVVIMVLRLEQVVGHVKSSEHYVKNSQPFYKKGHYKILYTR